MCFNSIMAEATIENIDFRVVTADKLGIFDIPYVLARKYEWRKGKGPCLGDILLEIPTKESPPRISNLVIYQSDSKPVKLTVNETTTGDEVNKFRDILIKEGVDLSVNPSQTGTLSKKDLRKPVPLDRKGNTTTQRAWFFSSDFEKFPRGDLMVLADYAPDTGQLINIYIDHEPASKAWPILKVYKRIQKTNDEV